MEGLGALRYKPGAVQNLAAKGLSRLPASRQPANINLCQSKLERLDKVVQLGSTALSRLTM
jgi:hypothetical protein